MALGTKAEIDRANEEARREYLKEQAEREASRLQKQEDKKRGKRKYFFFGRFAPK